MVAPSTLDDTVAAARPRKVQTLSDRDAVNQRDVFILVLLFFDPSAARMALERLRFFRSPSRVARDRTVKRTVMLRARTRAEGGRGRGVSSVLALSKRPSRPVSARRRLRGGGAAATVEGRAM